MQVAAQRLREVHPVVEAEGVEMSLGHNSGTRKPAAPVENARATREGGVLLVRDGLLLL
jgi:hypothetical protein